MPLGGICMVDKIEKDFGLISSMFKGILNKEEIGRVKILLNNKLTYTTSIHQILPTTSTETFNMFGVKNTSTRSLYRTNEKIGGSASLIMKRYQDFIKKNKFVNKNQNMDWSSIFLRGSKTDLAKYGYSRDKRPDMKQICFGISVGINGIPSAITIQNGNVVDKKHFNETYNIVKRVLEENTLLIFDCGANTKANKEKILKDEFNYLTLKQKNVKAYKKYINIYKNSDKISISINNQKYSVIKIKENNEFKYIYFSKSLLDNQISIKQGTRKQDDKSTETVLEK